MHLLSAGDPAPVDGPAPPHLSLGPWLQQPATDAITVVFETSAPLPGRVVVDGKSFDAGNGTHHEARVTGLAPSTAYRYHVEAGDAVTDETSFATLPAAGAPISFVVWGDHRTDGDDHRRGAQAVLAEQPDFIVDTGDLVDHSSEE